MQKSGKRIDCRPFTRAFTTIAYGTSLHIIEGLYAGFDDISAECPISSYVFTKNFENKYPGILFKFNSRGFKYKFNCDAVGRLVMHF